MRFDGIDTNARQIQITFCYTISEDERILLFAKENLGKDVTVTEMSSFIKELQEEI